MASDERRVARALVRTNSISLALVCGALVGAGTWLATVVLVAKGGPNPGPRLALLSQFFPGYSVTIPGAFVGFAWALLAGFAFTLPTAWLYFRGVIRRLRAVRASVVDGDVLLRDARIDVPTFAGAFGLGCGVALLLATAWLVAKQRPGEALGPHLSLLSQYLPGYDVSCRGAMVGFAYFGVLGGAVFAGVGLLYNRLSSRGSEGRSIP
jgi:hypothetical protein